MIRAASTQNTKKAGDVPIHELPSGRGHTVAWATPLLPDERPRYFMGIGDPAGILRECGLDAAGIVASIERRFGQPQLKTVAKPAA